MHHSLNLTGFEAVLVVLMELGGMKVRQGAPACKEEWGSLARGLRQPVQRGLPVNMEKFWWPVRVVRVR